MKRKGCPNCGNMLVESSGLPDAPILLVGEFPNFEEVRYGKIGVGKVGEILRHELARIGIQLSACRVVNLWQHAKSKECDVAWHLDQVSKEFPGHEWVLLMGTDITRAVVGEGIMEVAGLQVKSKAFPKVKFFAIPNAGTLMRGDVGEMRLALEKFLQKRRNKNGRRV